MLALLLALPLGAPPVVATSPPRPEPVVQPQRSSKRKPVRPVGRSAKARLQKPTTPAPPTTTTPSYSNTTLSMATFGGPVTSIQGTQAWYGNDVFMTANPITSPDLLQRFPTNEMPGLWHLRITNTPSGWTERFLLLIPHHNTSTEIPLLVAFHRFGNTMWDIVVNSDLPRHTNARGWYLLAPMGASDISFSSMESQMNTELVLGLVCDLFNVDQQRIYGIGHSMGGGNALNYAARHVDPHAPMFAALVNHTGELSQLHSYNRDCDPAVGSCQNQWLWEFWYGGPPSTHNFAYLRSSVIDIPYELGLPRVPPVDSRTDFARNLVHTPIQTWFAQNDPLGELIVQNLAFADHMADLGADHTLVTIPTNSHDWNLLDYASVLDWMEQHTLQLPTSGRTLADQDGVWFYFDVVQDRSNEFSPFTWSIDTATNFLEIRDTENLEQLTVDGPLSGLDLAAGALLTLHVDAGDRTGDQVRISGVQGAPVSVLRDGVPYAGWSMSHANSMLTLTEPTSGSHVWSIQF